ncbi:MAG: hypothetical protein ABI409_04845, partial [Ramlibacter sp.]
GNPYDPRVWSRIVFACGMLWGCLQVTGRAGPWASAGLSLMLYVVLVVWLGLFPRQIIDTILIERARRRLRPGA